MRKRCARIKKYLKNPYILGTRDPYPYFFKNLLKRFPDFSELGKGAGVGVPGLPKEGRGSAGFTALAGTAIGLRGVETPGRGAAGAGIGLGVEAPNCAIPGLGTGWIAPFSAWSAAVGGTADGMGRGDVFFSRAATIFSAVRLSWSIF